MTDIKADNSTQSQSGSREANPTSHREASAQRGSLDPSENRSGRPTTVRFPTAVQRQLEAVVMITGRSVSSLIREGVDLVIDKHMGKNPAAVIAKVAQETERRLRALYGLDSGRVTSHETGSEPGRGTISPTAERSVPDLAASSEVESGEVYSGRPTTVRFPTAVQKRLEVVAAITGCSVSSLIREGVDLVIDKHMGTDPGAVIAKVAQATEARLRSLLGLDAE